MHCVTDVDGMLDGGRCNIGYCTISNKIIYFPSSEWKEVTMNIRKGKNENNVTLNFVIEF